MQALAERLHVFASGRALRKAELLSFSSLRTFSPQVEDLYGLVVESITRRAKYLVWTFAGGARIVIHLSQAGRVDVESSPKTTRPRGAVVRFIFVGGSEAVLDTPANDAIDESGGAILVREYGRQRKAAWWVLAPGDEGPLEGLGPEPDSEEFVELVRTSTSTRRLHSDLRDQRVVAGIGRGWGDDIVHRSRLSPFVSLGSLNEEERGRLLAATTAVLAEALALERTRTGGLSEAKLGGRFAVHGKLGQPCPTPGCGDELRRVSFESYEMTYCATCQTGGKILADRRLSRLIK
jgi:formamidopyrimidine-DNA glycosylase